MVKVPDRAAVAVIGGGIIGACTALHLVREGVSNVVLLERDDVAQGTSAAAAGFVAMWAAGYIGQWGEEEVALERYGLAFYDDLAARGHDLDHRPNGTLWIASDEPTWE